MKSKIGFALLWFLGSSKECSGTVATIQGTRNLNSGGKPWYLPCCRNDEDWVLPSVPCLLNLLLIAPVASCIFEERTISCPDASNKEYFGKECICEYNQLVTEINNFKFANNEPLPLCPGTINFESEVLITDRDFYMYCFGQDIFGDTPPQCTLDGGGVTRLFTGKPESVTFANIIFSNGKASQGGAFFLEAGSAASFYNCTFQDNVADQSGHDLYFDGDSSVELCYGVQFCGGVSGALGGDTSSINTTCIDDSSC